MSDTTTTRGTQTFTVDTTLEAEGINPATPYKVTAAPYGEAITQWFATEAEALAEAASIAKAAKGQTYLTSWGEQPVDGHSSVTLFLAPPPALTVGDRITDIFTGATGAVTAIFNGKMKVTFDNGGTSTQPIHFGGYRLTPVTPADAHGVDALVDGERVYVAEELGQSDAYADYDRVVDAFTRLGGMEVSVRLIHAGDVVATTCIINGREVDGFDHRDFIN